MMMLVKRLIASGIALAACLVAVPTVGHAVQTSGSILVVPSKNEGLVPNELVTVDVYLNNSSTTTPGLSAVAATFSGPITLSYGCLDCACASTNNLLSFVPGPAAGCTSKIPTVTGCVGAGSNEVLINIDGGGVTVPPGGQVKIATVTMRAAAVLPQPPLYIGFRAMTTECGVKACETLSSGKLQCVDCAAEGCAAISDPTDVPCPHTCLSKIRSDFFEYHRMMFSLSDPSSNPFSILVTNSMGVVVSPDGTNPWTLPVGALVKTGTKTYVYSANIPAGGTGINYVKASQQHSGAWKVDIQIRQPGVGAKATKNLMTTTLTVGGRTDVSTVDWTDTAYGWSWEAKK